MNFIPVGWRAFTGSMAFIAFLCATTVSLAVTTSETRSILLLVRYATFSVCVLWVLYALVHRNVFGKEAYLSILVFSLLVSYGLLLSCIFGGIEMVISDLPLDLIFLLLGIAILSVQLKHGNNGNVFAVYVILAWLVVCLSIVSDGLIIENPPHFRFEAASDIEGATILYSQGMSKYMGLAALSSCVLLGAAKSFYVKCVAAGSSIAFLALSLLGGARGDSVIAALVVIAYVIINVRGGLILFLPSLGALLYLALDYSYLQDMVIVQRLTVVFEGDYGVRDILLSQAFDLISAQWGCMMFGCGFGFFQRFFGYSFDLYPHNVFVEMIISHGIILMLPVVIISILGIIEYQRRTGKRLDGNLAVATLFFLIALKSGTFLSSYVVVAFTCCFFAIGLFRLIPALRDRS